MKTEKHLLGDLLKITSGGTPSRSKPEYFKNGTIPWIKTGDLKVKDLYQAHEFITEQGLENCSAKIFPKNTLLVALYGATIGACSILKLEAATNQACGALLPSKNVVPDFLYFYFLSIRPKLINQGIGGGQPNISGQILKNTEIDLPSLSDQQKIASILQHADAARQKRKKANQLTEQFLQSAFLEMFGDPVRNEKGWEVKNLQEYISFLTSGSRGWAKYYSDKGDLFIRIENVGRSKLFLEPNKSQFVNAPESAESKRTLVQEGDLLISITADLGRTAIVPKLKSKAYINQHLALVRLKKGINPIFLTNYFSSSAGQTQFNSMNKGGVKAGLNFNDIKSLKFISPPLPLQKKFATLVEQVEQLRVKQRESEKELENLFQSLMQRYFG